MMLKHYRGDSKFEELFGLLRLKMCRSGGRPDDFGLKDSLAVFVGKQVRTVAGRLLP